MTIEIKNALNNTSPLNVDGVLHVGDDTQITNIYENSHHKAYFEEVKVTTSEMQEYVLPTFTKIVIEKFRKNRILFLGGGYNFNKDRFMKYLAFNSNYEGNNLLIKECVGLPGTNSLLYTINKENQPCVFLIYRATRESLEYDLHELKKVISAGKHYMIVSTSTSKEIWHFESSISGDIWYEIQLQRAYDPATLVGKIKDDLQNKGLAVPDYFNLEKAAIELGMPENIEMFIEKLHEQGSVKLTLEILDICLKSALPASASGISQWFQNLENDQKLLALGLAMFNGFRELQFFEAMDMLIEQGWTGRNHKLKSLDYQDVFPLLNYFKIENGYILAIYPEQTIALLATAWKTHRRFLETALPVLVKLVVQSTSEEVSNWTLYGSKWRGHLIREVMGNTLFFLGTIDFASIEPSLLSMAASQNFEVRMVAAEVLANLRRPMQDEWYHTLYNWQNNPAVQDMVSSMIAKTPDYQQEEQAHLPSDYILATIVAALGSAAQKDAVNKLDSRLLGYFTRMVRYRNKPLILKSVQHTLWSISARHTLQVAESLRNDFLLHSVFIESIAAGLADGYNNLHPNATRTVIFNWLDQINDSPTPRKNYTDLLHEDKVLCCIIRTLQLIDYHFDSRITVEEAYNKLEFLRQHNHQPRVRSYLIKAIVSLIEEYLRNPNQQTITYISNLDEKERDQLVHAFRRQYLSERTEQTGGDYVVNISGRLIPIWEVQSDRVATNMEILMRQWLNHSDPAIIQIATMSLLKFSEIEDIERRSLELHIEELDQISEVEEEILEEAPFYNSTIAADSYTHIFIKIASQIVRPIHLTKLQHIAPVFMQTGIMSDTQLTKVMVNFDDPDSEIDAIIPQLVFLYNLFKSKDVNIHHSPFISGFWARLLVTLSTTAVTAAEQNRYAGWAPILIQNPAIHSYDLHIIFQVIGYSKSKNVSLFRFFHRNNWVWWAVIVFIGVMFLLLLL